MAELFCPLLKERCKAERCAWYDLSIDGCVLLSISDSLDVLWQQGAK